MVSLLDEMKAAEADSGGGLHRPNLVLDRAVWSEIFTDFDPDEETANFGTRHAIEAAGKLFDVFTSATIQPQGQVTNNPQVLSSPSAGDKMALALDSCLHVINNDFSCCPSGGAAIDAEDSSPDEAAISTAVAVSLRFPSQIDCLSWTPCCNFVLLGLGSGEAQLLHVPTKTPLPPVALLDRDRQIGLSSGFKAFAGCWTEKAKAGPLSTLCLASTDFKVFRLKDVNLEGLHQGLLEKDFAGLKRLQGLFKVEMVSETEISTRKNPMSTLTALMGSRLEAEANDDDNDVRVDQDEESEKGVFFGDLGNRMGVMRFLNPRQGSTSGNDPQRSPALSAPELILSSELELDGGENVGVVSIKAPKHISKDLLFVLTSDGRLHIVCPFVMVELFTWCQETVLDLNLLEDEGDPVLKLMMICHRNGEHFLQIREFPAFKLIYELKVTPFCKLLHSSANQETLYVIEGAFNSLSTVAFGEAPLVESLRIRGVCEGSPDIRLSRLLRRNKFDEAEQFAELNHLNYEAIHRARASWLMGRLSPWSRSSGIRKILPNQAEVEAEQQQKDLEKFKATLRRMRDLDFMVRCCVMVALPSLKDTRDLLLLARAAIQENVSAVDFDMELMCTISKTLQKLETFTHISRNILVASAVQKEDHQVQSSVMDRWSAFYREEPLALVGRYLSEENLEAAALVWQRHQPEFAAALGVEKVDALLGLLKTEAYYSSGDLDAKDRLALWLKEFVPACLRLLPESLPIIAKWTVQTTKRLELGSRKAWPANGLEFAKLVIEVMHFCEQLSAEDLREVKSMKMPMVLHQQRSDKSSDLYLLASLVEALQDLEALYSHSKLRMQIRLDDYMQEDKTEVVNLLLDWCSSGQEVLDLQTHFLISFFGRFRLDGPTVLANYALKLMEESGTGWFWEIGSTAPWEDKVVSIASILLSSADSIPGRGPSAGGRGTAQLQFKVILEAFKLAPVPWSEGIKSLRSIGHSLPSDISDLISEQEKLVELKQILQRYGYRSGSRGGPFCCAPGREAEATLNLIITKGCSLQEALVASKLLPGLRIMDARIAYIRHLLDSKADHREALLVVQDAENPADAVEICESIYMRAQILARLDFKTYFDSSSCWDTQCQAPPHFGEGIKTLHSYQPPYLLLLKASPSVISKMQGEGEPKKFDRDGMPLSYWVSRFEADMEEFGNRCFLKAVYDCNLPESGCFEEKLALLNSQVTMWTVSKYADSDNNKQELAAMYNKLKVFAHLLGIPLAQALNVLMGCLAEQKKFGALASVAELLLEVTRDLNDQASIEKLAPSLLGLIGRVSHVLAAGSMPLEDDCHPMGELPKALAALAALVSETVTLCSAATLEDAIFVSCWLQQMTELVQQFHHRDIFATYHDNHSCHSIAKDGRGMDIMDIARGTFTPTFVDKAMLLPNDVATLSSPASFLSSLYSINDTDSWFLSEGALPYFPRTMFCSLSYDSIGLQVEPTAAETRSGPEEDEEDDDNVTKFAWSQKRISCPVETLPSPLGPSICDHRRSVAVQLFQKTLDLCVGVLEPNNHCLLTLAVLRRSEMALWALGASISTGGNTPNHQTADMLRYQKFRELSSSTLFRLVPKVLSEYKRPDLALICSMLLAETCVPGLEPYEVKARRSVRVLEKTAAFFDEKDPCFSSLAAATRLTHVGMVGAKFCSIAKLPSRHRTKFKNLLVRASWVRRAADSAAPSTSTTHSGIGSSSSNRLLGPEDAKWFFNTEAGHERFFKFLGDLVDKCIDNPLSVADVLRFCSAFRLEKTEALSIYVQTTLTSSLLDPYTRSQGESSDEDSHIRISSRLDNATIQRMSLAIDSIPERMRREELIERLFKAEVNPYNYEVLQFLLEKRKQICRIPAKNLRSESSSTINSSSKPLSSTVRFLYGHEGEDEDEGEVYEDEDDEQKRHFILRALKMVKFLRNYERVEKPKEDEVDRWLRTKRGQSFPVGVASRRLPLDPTLYMGPKDTFKLLADEFNLANVRNWTSVDRAVFRLSPDNICFRAIQNAVQSKIRADSAALTKERNNSWERLLEEIERCLETVGDYYKATTVAYWIINRLPDERIDEKLTCARISTRFAEKWHHEAADRPRASSSASSASPDESESKKGLGFALVTQVRLEVEQVLRRHSLLQGDGGPRCQPRVLQELLKQGKVKELVTELYHHPSILDRAKKALAPCQPSAGDQGKTAYCYPDINGAVEEISEVYANAGLLAITPTLDQSNVLCSTIDFDLVKYNLLDDWLQDNDSLGLAFGGGIGALDETTTTNLFDPSPSGQNGASSSSEDQDNYVRSVYLLQGFQNRKGLDYLLLATQDGATTVSSSTSAEPGFLMNETVAFANATEATWAGHVASTAQKLRTLKCLLSVAKPEELQASSVCCLQDDQQGYLERRFLNLSFLARLEKLNLVAAHDTASFEKCDKIALIEAILRSSSYRSEGISLVVDLCLAYEVFKPALWTGLLKRMMMPHLGSQLRSALVELNCRPALWNVPTFVEAWNYALMEPLSRYSAPLTRRQEDECLSGMAILKRCPVAADLDLKSLLAECARLNIPSAAAELILPLLSITEEDVELQRK